MWKKIYINNEKTNYSVSNKGEVRNDITKRMINGTKQYGYLRVSLVVNKHYIGKSIHRLVAEAFIPNINNYPIINHINGKRDDNRVENLEWCTYSYNTKEAYRMKKFVPTKPVNQYNLKGELMWTFSSITEAANETGTIADKISEVCNRKRKSTNQYQWRFVDDEQDVYNLYTPPTLPRRVGQYKDGKLINTYRSFTEAAKAVEGTESAISRICSGVNKTHKGYEWKIVEDIVQELE